MRKHRRRSRFQIVYKTLQLCSSSAEGLTKNQLVIRTNSTFERVKQLTKLLVDQGLLQGTEANGVEHFKLTPKGLTVIKAMNLVAISLGANSFEVETEAFNAIKDAEENWKSNMSW